MDKGIVRTRSNSPGPSFVVRPYGGIRTYRPAASWQFLGYAKGVNRGDLTYFGKKFANPFDANTTSADVQAWAESNKDALMDAAYAHAYAEYFSAVFAEDYSLISQEAKSMTDYVIKNFKSRSKAGEIFNNPLSRDDWSFESTAPGTSSSLTVSLSDDILQGTIGTSWGDVKLFNSVLFTAEADAVALEPSVMTDILTGLPPLVHMSQSAAHADAIANLSNTDFDGLLFAAEFGKTAQHLAYTAQRIFNIYRAIKKGKFSALAPKTFKKWRSGNTTGKAKLTLDIISDAWLEARYAWRPLLLDTEKVLKLLTKGSSFTPRKTFRGGDSDDSSSTGSFSFNSARHSYHVEYDELTVSSARAGILAEIEQSLSAELGFFDVLNVGWELVPFSFVVDWFINVGGLLQSINPNPAVKPLTAWVTLTTERASYGSILITSLSTSKQSTVYFKLREMKKDRIVNPEPPGITLDVDLDVSKLLDSVALLWRLK